MLTCPQSPERVRPGTLSGLFSDSSGVPGPKGPGEHSVRGGADPNACKAVGSFLLPFQCGGKEVADLRTASAMRSMCICSSKPLFSVGLEIGSKSTRKGGVRVLCFGCPKQGT